MILVLQADGSSSLENPEDVGRFHCEIDPVFNDIEAARQAWADIVEIESREVAWVDLPALQALGILGGGETGADWGAATAAMAHNAARHGWFREQPPAIKSHIVWRGSSHPASPGKGDAGTPRAGMKFGIFDHLDHNGAPLSELYEGRLKLAEAYDRAGFYAYHLAEHHGTPLGAAGSPSVFLAALAQRTRRLRFGPLVYVLSTSHPLRILEEICMLDQMSNGRLEVGIGRGTSPYEMGHFGIDANQSLKIYTEAYSVIMQGLQSGEINFEGEHFRFSKVPVLLRCLQKPHPPLWYGLSSPDAVPWVARNGINVVCNGPSAPVRLITNRYRAIWRSEHGDAPLPLLGLGRHLMVAPTYKEAFDLGKRAFDVWYASLQHLWRAHGKPLTRYSIPEDFKTAVDAGILIVGTPGDVIAGLEREAGIAGVNYMLVRFAYGDLQYDESAAALDLFVREVMPHFQQQEATA